MYSVEYGTKKILFEIERKVNLKNTYITVDTEGVVVKTNDSTTIEEINKMVMSKRKWITKKLNIFKV